MYGTTQSEDFLLLIFDVDRPASQIDEDFMARYQMSYGFNPDGTKDENPVKYDDNEDALEHEIEEEAKRKLAEEKKKKEKQPASALNQVLFLEYIINWLIIRIIIFVHCINK